MEIRTEEFEQLLLIHRPESYEKYQEAKKENNDIGFDHIVWKTPDSNEEAALILDAMLRTDHLVNNPTNKDKEIFETEDDSPEINFIKQFEGIDISKLGEING